MCVYVQVSKGRYSLACVPVCVCLLTSPEHVFVSVFLIVNLDPRLKLRHVVSLNLRELGLESHWKVIEFDF